MALLLAPTVIETVRVWCHPREDKCLSNIMANTASTVFEQQSVPRKVPSNYHVQKTPIERDKPRTSSVIEDHHSHRSISSFLEWSFSGRVVFN